MLESLKERRRKSGHQCCTFSRTEDCLKNACRLCFAQQILDDCPVSRCAVFRQRGGGRLRCLFEGCLKYRQQCSRMVVCLDQLLRIVSCFCLPRIGIGRCWKQGYDFGTSCRKNMIARRPRLQKKVDVERGLWRDWYYACLDRALAPLGV